MLRETTPTHADWCDMTMSMMREKQFEACERRLFAHPSIALFSKNVTQMDAQSLYLHSYYAQTEGENHEALVTLEALREKVLNRLPLEMCYITANERQLLERLLIHDGTIWLMDDDDISAAESLISRLWCSFRAVEDAWELSLPEALHVPMLEVLQTKQAQEARQLCFRFDATIHGLLYIAGLLHSAQPIGFFLKEVMNSNNALAYDIAIRYLKASFEYVSDHAGELILLHPGLASPQLLIQKQLSSGMFSLELSEEMMSGGMNGILKEEIALHEAMMGALFGALRPECEATDVAEDLRMLAKQAVSYGDMLEVMASVLTVMPTEAMKDALLNLHQQTPRWIGLKAALVH